eukprot:600085-Prorocentrum_minimum.AAC.1
MVKKGEESWKQRLPFVTPALDRKGVKEAMVEMTKTAAKAAAAKKVTETEKGGSKDLRATTRHYKAARVEQRRRCRPAAKQPHPCLTNLHTTEDQRPVALGLDPYGGVTAHRSVALVVSAGREGPHLALQRVPLAAAPADKPGGQGGHGRSR